MVLFSCSEKESPSKPQDTFWIYTSEIPCDNFDTTIRCIFTLKEKELDYDIKKWVSLNENSELVDFEYETGFFYQLTVELPDKNGPNPTQYKVLKVNQKIKDYTKIINGSWTLLKIKDTAVPLEKQDKFILQIEEWRRRIYLVTDCKFYYGELGKVDESNFLINSLTSDDIGQKDNCDGFGLINTLLSSKNYSLINLDSLIFTDAKQNIALILKKIPGYNPYRPKGS